MGVSIAGAGGFHHRKAGQRAAGPDRGYPLVVWLPAGTAVYVNGRLSDYRWCDVTAGPDRGWVFARNLQYSYQGQPVTIYGNGARLTCRLSAYSRQLQERLLPRPSPVSQPESGGTRGGPAPTATGLASTAATAAPTGRTSAATKAACGASAPRPPGGPATTAKTAATIPDAKPR